MTSKIQKPGGRPTKTRAAELGNQILDGARIAFCRNGIARTSIDEIADRMGVSKHTIYRRFAGKDAILKAVVERDIALFAAELKQAASGADDALEALRLSARRYFEIGSSRSYAGFYLSVNAEAAFDPSVRDQLASWSRSALTPMRDAIGRAQSDAFLRAGNPARIEEILVDLVEGAVNRVRLHPGEMEASVAQTLFDDRWTVFLGVFRAVPMD